jgi:hypothetical protein
MLNTSLTLGTTLVASLKGTRPTKIPAAIPSLVSPSLSPHYSITFNTTFGSIRTCVTPLFLFSMFSHTWVFFLLILFYFYSLWIRVLFIQLRIYSLSIYIYIYIKKKKEKKKVLSNKFILFLIKQTWVMLEIFFVGRLMLHITLMSQKMDVALKITVGSKFNSDLS